MLLHSFHKFQIHFSLCLTLLFLVLIPFEFVTSYAIAGDEKSQALALTNGILIDGTGAAPISKAVILIKDGRIAAVEKSLPTTFPLGVKVIDLKGATILPGFINVHVHGAFDPAKLTVWARAGVTAVRDLRAGGESSVENLVALRNSWRGNPDYARLFTVGPMITVPGGYGSMYVDSPEEARHKVNNILDIGVDLIKVSMEDGYAGVSGLPKLTMEELTTIVNTAHERGTLVTAHVTQAKYLDMVIKAGVDEAAHNCYDYVPDPVIENMVKKGVYMTPTFTVYRNYNVLVPTFDNLRRFVKAGGKVALGNDYGGGPGQFELGMPMFEIECMQRSEMTPMEIIMAGTKNAAHVCHMEKELGTLEVGKLADILVVNGDPLKNMKNLLNVRMVVKDGVIIQDSNLDAK